MLQRGTGEPGVGGGGGLGLNLGFLQGIQVGRFRVEGARVQIRKQV